MTFRDLFDRSSVAITCVSIILLVFSESGFGAISWDTPPELIQADWTGSAPITASSSDGEVTAVKNSGNRRNFRVKGNGDPALSMGSPYELSATDITITGPLVITTTTFTSGGRFDSLVHDERSRNFRGGNNVGVELEITISQDTLLAAEAGTYKGDIDLCIGSPNQISDGAPCNIGNNNVDEAIQSIEIIIPKRVAVSGLGNIGALSYIPGNPATGTTNFCIGTNSPDGVRVTFSSDASSGYGLVGDSSGEDLPYTLTFTAGASDVTPAVDTPTTAFTDGVDKLTCGTETASMQLDISVADGDITSAGDTDFTENLVLLVEPE